MKGRITLNFALALFGIACCVAFFFLLPTLARAEDKLVKPGMHFMVLMALKDIDIQPIVVSWFNTADECYSAASKANAEDARLKVEEWDKAGARYVCVRIVQEPL